MSADRRCWFHDHVGTGGDAVQLNDSAVYGSESIRNGDDLPEFECFISVVHFSCGMFSRICPGLFLLGGGACRPKCYSCVAFARVCRVELDTLHRIHGGALYIPCQGMTHETLHQVRPYRRASCRYLRFCSDSQEP